MLVYIEVLLMFGVREGYTHVRFPNTIIWDLGLRLCFVKSKSQTKRR